MANPSTAVCTDSAYDWAFNSLRQSPCVVAQYLGGVCNGGIFLITPLQQGRVYLGPTKADANNCRCSSVFYSLVSACAACQSGQYLPWSSYNTNCTAVYDTVFPESIPGGTKVPHWAYLDVSAGNTFNDTVAQGALSAPESSAIPTSTQSFTYSGTTTPTSKATSNGSKAGPIAGGVIGGVVGLGLIMAAVLLWWSRRRRGPKTAPSSLIEPGYGGGIIPNHGNMTQAMLEPKRFDNASTTATITPFPVSPSPPRIYDPSDPDTYPPSLPAPSVILTTQEQPLSYHPANSHYNPSVGGRYTGVPEI